MEAKKIKIGKRALTISVITLITVLIWMVFDIYWAVTRTEVPRILQSQIAPLNPKIAAPTLNQLESRLSFSEDELNTVSQVSLKKETLEEESEEATQTGQPEEATEGEEESEEATGAGLPESE